MGMEGITVIHILHVLSILRTFVVCLMTVGTSFKGCTFDSMSCCDGQLPNILGCMPWNSYIHEIINSSHVNKNNSCGRMKAVLRQVWKVWEWIFYCMGKLCIHSRRQSQLLTTWWCVMSIINPLYVVSTIDD